VPDKVKCDGGCGGELLKADGWVYVEQDYTVMQEDGKIGVEENTRRIFCPKCAKGLVLEPKQTRSK